MQIFTDMNGTELLIDDACAESVYCVPITINCC